MELTQKQTYRKMDHQGLNMSTHNFNHLTFDKMPKAYTERNNFKNGAGNSECQHVEE